MTTPLAALRDFFVEPPEAVPQPSASVTPLNPEPLAPLPAPCVAVLARASECGAATAVVALALARAQGARCAVAAGWHVDWRSSPRVGAVSAARRVGLRLEAVGLAARATGRLVRVRLPDEPAAAAAAAERTMAGASCPVAIGLAGPRDPALDDLLATADLIVVVQRPGADTALARAVEAGLAHLTVPVTTCQIRVAGPLRALATAGIATPRRTRESVLPALEAVRREASPQAAFPLAEALR
jgi:hypothetical protein